MGLPLDFHSYYCRKYLDNRHITNTLTAANIILVVGSFIAIHIMMCASCISFLSIIAVSYLDIIDAILPLVEAFQTCQLSLGKIANICKLKYPKVHYFRKKTDNREGPQGLRRAGPSPPAPHNCNPKHHCRIYCLKTFLFLSFFANGELLFFLLISCDAYIRHIQWLVSWRPHQHLL